YLAENRSNPPVPIYVYGKENGSSDVHRDFGMRISGRILVTIDNPDSTKYTLRVRFGELSFFVPPIFEQVGTKFIATWEFEGVFSGFSIEPVGVSALPYEFSYFVFGDDYRYIGLRPFIDCTVLLYDVNDMLVRTV